MINPFWYSAPPPSGDPYWANVSLLLHCDGTNGSTTFTDQKGKTMTAVGNAQLSTTTPKYGTACLLLDGSGDWVTTPGSADFDFGTGDFTVEWFYRYTNVNGYHYFYDIGNHGFYARIQSGNYLMVGAAGPGNVLNTAIAQLSTVAWYHMAVVRSGTTWKFYIDGTSIATGTSGASVGSSSNTFYIGSYGGGSGLSCNGRLDEFRVTKGVARYTSNFTPPTQAFPDS